MCFSQQADQEIIGVCNNGQIYIDSFLANFGWVNVNHNESGVWCKQFLGMANDRDCQPAANDKKHVTVLNGEVACPITY